MNIEYWIDSIDLPSHNVSAFQFCHLLAFHTPVLVCERRKTMRKFRWLTEKKIVKITRIMWFTHVWYCCWRKLNSSFIRSKVSAIVNLIGPCCGGPYKKGKKKKLMNIYSKNTKLVHWFRIVFLRKCVCAIYFISKLMLRF